MIHDRVIGIDSPSLPARPSSPTILDDFESITPWSATPSDGVGLTLASDAGHTGRALRMDVDFHGGGGYAVAHRALPVDLPENYELSFWIRGTIPANNLEFKLIDASGDNVWWVNRRDFAYPDGWTRVVIKKRQISFAWGALGGGDLKHAAALELAVTAGSGGRGSVWIDDLELAPREPVRPYDLTPALTASSGDSAAAAMDSAAATAWHSGADGAQALSIDFLRARELGGLTVDWDSLDYAADYAVLTSADGARWDTAYTVRGGDGGRDYVYLPETEARHLRLALTRSSRGRGYAVREISIKPLAWSASRNDFFAAVAADAPRGSYPRYLLGEQSYWTITGVDGDSTEALVSEEGIVETGKARFSLEPFLSTGGRLVTWADGRATQSLERGYLPIPSVRREAGALALTVTAFTDGPPGASRLWVRYRVENRGTREETPTLYVALRPFQVNPSAQFLNGSGGAAIVNSVAWDGTTVRVNGRFVVKPLTRPAAFGAATFDNGNVVDALRRERLPSASAVHDPFGAASAALAYPLAVAPGGHVDVWIAAPMHVDADTGAPVVSSPAEANATGERHLAATVREWEAKLNRVVIDLPPSGQRIANSIRSNLAYVLINRDGPSIQPGSRSYERSWIRDGSLTSAALLRLGHADDVRAFAEWYAPYQFASGKVPCCVDRRGADPVPENDSHGELIYLIAEYARHTGDRAFLRRMWPHVSRSVAYIDSLRHLRMTAEYQTPEKRAFHGLLPESISHEGYSAKPMHSYWDDSFALRGLKDATWIADVLGRPERAAYARMRDDFQRDLLASYRASMAMHHIDFLPGSVELGDFDATSTTVAVSPGGAQRDLPHPALERTFEKYWEGFTARRDGRAQWDGYTPYEWRTVGTMVRLGWKERALEAVDWFFEHQRPPAWNAWGEVVYRDPLTTKFIGDLPHTWVGSDFIRSALDLFAYERDDEGVLVIGAGIPAAWVTEAPGVSIRGLSTHFGPLSYTMRAEGGRVRLRIAPGLRTPPGGLVIRSPLDRPVRIATADGAAVRVVDGTEVRLARVPRVVELRY
ncbi:MAG TPA: discoidin domain-containing protein [Longimicrobium sp.]|nr:discoidin domain-containing protein [Longimicrobium sp.]